MKIQTRENSNKNTILDNAATANNLLKNTFIRTRTGADNLLNDNENSSEEYANELLDDMTEEFSTNAQNFVKNKFKKSVFKRQSVNKSIRQTENIRAVEQAKNRVVNNIIKQKMNKPVTVKDKVTAFIRGGKKTTLNTAKNAIKSTNLLVSALSSGGVIAVMLVIVVCLIGLLSGSPYGILMATEDTGTGMTINTVMEEINKEYLEEIEKIKASVPHDYVEIIGEGPQWKEILAVYAVKTTSDFNGMEVVTVTEEKKEIIRDIFWQMTKIEYSTETIIETEQVEITDENGETYLQDILVEKIYLRINIKKLSNEEVFEITKLKYNERMLYTEIVNRFL